ncbi:uncharacterized protein LOC110817070 [Carica papaya]|uniref:uncharacterized protein LOC110817070 n=1 Tax=Carica papaya TaxID=3649 RepID=UPI000B8CBD02|nr:uncharacterized protein LOC110817070 [Carica papaya]
MDPKQPKQLDLFLPKHKLELQPKPNQTHQYFKPSVADQNNKRIIWDCGSTLYDSFELNSFRRQLDSTISRTLSMSHVPDPLPPSVPKKSSKLSRSLNKFFRSVFKFKRNNGSVFDVNHRSQAQYYDKSGALTTILEVPEIDLGGFSPEMIRKTASERFTSSSLIGISYA